ncbi:MAG: 50S ribosomal protein L30 [Candidatus Phytoplasma pyri]|uniref:50S ribosomal protein L30 n=1 Tax=Candidatus Phytoplasma pyri TaxID=47566 RepID=UPI0039830802
MKKPQFIIILNKSLIARTKSQIQTAHTLGLRKINQKVIKDDNPVNRGMMRKIYHLVTIEKI